MEYPDPKLNAWVGIDPGATGAYSILRENGSFDIEDWEDEFVLADAIADGKSSTTSKLPLWKRSIRCRSKAFRVYSNSAPIMV